MHKLFYMYTKHHMLSLPPISPRFSLPQNNNNKERISKQTNFQKENQLKNSKKAKQTESTQKPWSPCSAGELVLGMGPGQECGWFAKWYSIGEMEFPSPRNYQLQMVRGGTLYPRPFLGTDYFFCCDPVQILYMLPQFCEFMCASVRLYLEAAVSLE